MEFEGEVDDDREEEFLKNISDSNNEDSDPDECDEPRTGTGTGTPTSTISLCSDYDKNFLDGSRGPPCLDFVSNQNTVTVIHKFVGGVDIKNPKTFFVQYSKLLDDLAELERNMNTWYNKYFFAKELYHRKNWTHVWEGGYFAAYLPIKDKWVRCWIDEIVFSNSYLEYVSGYFDVHIRLLDYAMSEIVPRRYILPLRQCYIELPMIGYIASLQMLKSTTDALQDNPSICTTFNEDLENLSFSAVVMDQQDYIDLPYRVLKVAILMKNTNGLPHSLHTLHSHLTCGYTKVIVASSSLESETKKEIKSTGDSIIGKIFSIPVGIHVLKST